MGNPRSGKDKKYVARAYPPTSNDDTKGIVELVIKAATLLECCCLVGIVCGDVDYIDMSTSRVNEILSSESKH